MVIINSLAALSLTTFSLLAQNADVGWSAQKRIDSILGRPAVSAFCGPPQAARLAGPTKKTREDIAEKALEPCWAYLAADEPRLARPPSEYPSTFSDWELGQLEAIASIGMMSEIGRQILSEEGATLDKQAVRTGSRIFGAWADALAVLNDEHKKNHEALAAALQAFAETGYFSLFAILDQKIIVSTRNGNEVDERILANPPDWMRGLRDLGLKLSTRRGRGFARSALKR